MNRSEERIRSHYRVISRAYDIMDRILFPHEDQNPRIGLARTIPDGTSQILDFCCGTGSSAIAIAASHPEANVIGIDLTEEMLQVADAKVQEMNLRNLVTRRLDATATDYPDDRFDVVTTSLSLHEMELATRHAILKEMVRVLRPGGLVCIVDWDAPDRPLSRAFFNFFPAAFEPAGFAQFLKLDWKRMLSPYGLAWVEEKRYHYTKLIVARKE